MRIAAAVCTPSSSRSGRDILVHRPLNIALGYGGQLLLFASGSVMTLAHAQSQPYCNDANPQICTVSSETPLTAPLTFSNTSEPQQVTNTANLSIEGASGTTGLQVLSHGNSGSTNGDSQNGQAGQGAMLTTSGSIELLLGSVTPAGMVVGVGVSSVGGDGAIPDDHGNGGDGGSAGSTTLFNSSNVTISGGSLNAGVVGALVESRGGNAGNDHSAVIDNYGGNGGGTQNIELDNYANVALGTSSDFLLGGTRAWGVAAQSLGGDGAFNAKGQLPMGQGGSGSNVKLLSNRDVSVYFTQTGAMPDGVVGLLARSAGARGGDTNWTHDNAGDGGSGGPVQLTAGDGNLGYATNINVGVQPSGEKLGSSAGILAQSTGGDGGVQQSNGATGGDAGDGSDITVDLHWVNLATTGDNVSGVVATSRGGNGGGDSMNSYRTDGGNGGRAGNVSIELQSKGNQSGQQTSISTNGVEAIGVLAQSIGGFGGSAVKNAGQGTDGATASITADANTIVTTASDYAIGMLAQSIGGGGGTGEDFASGLIGGDGNGGNGGGGASATIQTSANVSTHGQFAHGIIAQSLGGSGGAGAVNSGIVALGGDGGAGGAGGPVTISGAPQVSTTGDSAIGIIGQSVGGGGGVGGSASGIFAVGGSVSDAQDNNAGAVNVAGGTVSTQGDGAIAVLAQSIGGGGGSGGSAAGISAVGGSGASGGAGGAVTVDPGTDILTLGDYALGVVAQSIGGGGGNGGHSLAISVDMPTVSIGGSAGSASSGSTVTVQNALAGNIGTSGNGSIGLLAQSIGGGGGNGGSATLESLQAAAAVAIGGTAGGGGDGGNVDISLNKLNVSTAGIAAGGIVAQSIGGGGGNGGAAHSFNANIGFSLGVAVGGSGGSGGAANAVKLNLDNVTINTAGVGTNGGNGSPDGASVERSDSYGIVAQSIGGGGGNGGSASAKSIIVPVPVSEDASFAISADVAVGGAGGVGGTGGEVNIQLLDSTAIYTGGQGSHGVIAQSIGGGGGNGGASNAMSTDVSVPSQSVDLNLNVGVGGRGGNGGTGAGVTLGMGPAASITTFDDLSNGVLAQSIGGGGGNAGVGSSGSGGVSQGKAYTVSVGVGGSAGSGNTGGAITATTASGSAITTYGSGSRGMVLHSVGGGGGAAQGTTVDVGLPLSKSGGGGGEAEDEPSQGTTKLTASVSVSVGATGGSGGDGGAVSLTSGTTVTTTGGDADGALIQSIGGGGGLGGNAGADASAGPSSYSVATMPSENPPENEPEDNDLGTYSLAVGVGGSGGASGNGGAVTVNYSGLITTHGNFADAMVVQSIGAGGGAGGTSTAKNAKGSSSANIAVGGHGGAGGDGGDITLNMFAGSDSSDKFMFTYGDVSYGLLAQSIGGGGGQGGISSDILTRQSTQDADLAVGLALGGDGGNAGSGGNISLNAPNSIVTARTYGQDSHGIVLQSIGGGGGVAAASGLSLGYSGIGSLLRLQLGGGGARGNSMGGDIDLDSIVRVQTTGDHAFGLVAQSIGGGGGIVSAGQGANIQSVNIEAPVVGGSLQSGKLDIELVSGGGIDTSGRGAHGIVLQSIAGGGGIGGDTAVGALKTGWADGEAEGDVSWRSGDISLTLNSAVGTSGAGAHGIIAQSLAAAGGLGGNSEGSFAGALAQSTGGTSGSITMALNAEVWASGDNSFAVFAQTYDGSSAPAPVDITVSSQVVGAAAPNADGGGIWIDSPATSSVTVTTNGIVQGPSAILQTGTGKTNVVNSGGIILGNLSLGGSNAASMGTLSNSGTFSDASLMHGHLINQGQVFIGKNGGSDTLRVSGDFTQGSQGTLHVETDFVSRRTDHLQVDGSAKVDGQVHVMASSLMPHRELTFLQAGAVTPTAAVLGESGLFTYQLRQVDNTLTVSADAAKFDDVSTLYGVGSNLHALGQHLQDMWDHGSKEELGATYAALNRSAGYGSASYSSALHDLSPGVLAAPAALKQSDMLSFFNSLMSCPGFTGTSAHQGEGDCVWGRITGNTTRMDGSGGTAGLQSEGVGYQFGAQRSIAPNWYLGVAAAYEDKTMRADNRRQRIKGDTGYLGLSLKYETGPWAFSAALTGSRGSFNNTRSVPLTGVQAESDSRVISIGQRLRAAYTHATPSSYVKPFVDLDVIHTRMPSFEESGAGALNLHVEGISKWSAILSPGVEIGGRYELDNGYTVRPYASVGVSLSTSGKWDTRARFASAPAGTDTFTSTLDAGRVFGQVSGGIQVLSKKGMDVRLQYDGLISDKVRSHSGSLKATWRF